MAAILIEDEGAVRILTLNRPEVRNALDRELRQELALALRQATEAETVRAVVLTGAGTAFCAGMDLGELEHVIKQSSAENRQDSKQLADLFHQLYTLPKPVVGALNGHAVAGGAGLATACDLTVMSTDAKMGFTESRIGFVAALVSVFLVRQVGEKRARDLLLSGRLISAQEAEALGLANEVTPSTSVVSTAISRASALAANAPGSLAMTKTLLASIPGMGLEDGLRFATELNALSRTSAELQEGIRAFLEKRRPSWSKEDNETPNAT
ncbi:MAG: enoyl-CoA hydratase/isomerase family protein [Trueperaceae bacterium]|nr:MAG: enoyl-CoA hydratase/isomerase family protein [Trueperaceae bacterium]